MPDIIMSQGNPKNWKKSVQHPSEDDLLCYIDGELSPKLTESLCSHLEACWHCRNRAEKFQAAISLFIDYRSQVVQPLIETPNNWSGFGSKLRDVAAEIVPPSLWQRWRTTLDRLRVSLQEMDVRAARLTAISAFTILLGIAGVYFLLISSQTIVSAEELINRAAASRENELRNTDQPVLYQQLRVKRRDAQGEDSANIELWQDVDNSRMRQVASPKTSADASEVQKLNVLADLDNILRANNYEPPPLSIIGFRAWRKTLPEKRDLVEEAKIDEGISVLRLSTEITTQPVDGQLIASVLVVRASDYHPLEQHFRVMSADGVQEFELRETSFAVMSLNSLNPGFFADSSPVVTSARPLPSPGQSPEEVANATTVAVSVPGAVATGTLPNVVATAELEVEVLDLLHNAGADLGEQIEVKRMPNGPVMITGVVETLERKNQILNALQSVSGNPAVKIQINTVADEIARQKQAKAQPKPSVENVEVEGDTFPAEADLRAHFNGSDQAVRQFASRMTGRSSQAMTYLWAMKRLKSQFTVAELQKLTPEARSKWLNVIRSYARSYQSEIAALKRELQPVFGVSAGAGDGASVNSDAELMQTVDRLFEAGSGSNQVVRQAFTTGSGTNALKTAQFWRMLSEAEGLAKSIAEARTK